MPTVIADWKSGKFVGFEPRLQIAGYALCCKEQGLCDPDYGLVVQTLKDRTSIAILMDKQELAEAADVLLHLKAAYDYMKQQGQIREEERYQIQVDGKTEPFVSVTQIMKFCIAKPGLLNWYSKMAKEGKDPNAVRDQRGEEGKTIHKNILYFLQGKSVDLTQCPAWLASTMAKFYVWAIKYQVKPALMEQKVWSMRHRFAGRLDFVGSMELTKEVKE